MKIKFITCCLISLLFITCKKDATTEISEQARDYLNELLYIMENNSINRHKIDWVDFRNKVFSSVKNAQTINDTYPGIKNALRLLGDNHSSLIQPNGQTIYVGSFIYQIENIATPITPNDVGYVKVAAYSGLANNELAIDYATQIQVRIKDQDNIGLKGWIVDLRNNTGGNMWPMIVGIGPILGEGVAGYFIDPDGYESSWGFQDGVSLTNGYPVTQLSNSYKLLKPAPKVAVLLNSNVASSGEVIAVSFIGRENTRSFGMATSGLSTSNRQFKLSDNSILNLTVSYEADRNKKIYGVPINPDQVSSKETIINDALAWIVN